MFIQAYPINFLCGREPERLQKTQDCQQNVDYFHMGP